MPEGQTPWGDPPQDHPRSTARIAGRPIHPMLVPFPVVCFVGVLATDIAYAKTANMQWANFSAWLLTIGLIVTVFVALAGVIDFLGDRRIRQLNAAWIHGVAHRGIPAGRVAVRRDVGTR